MYNVTNYLLDHYLNDDTIMSSLERSFGLRRKKTTPRMDTDPPHMDELGSEPGFLLSSQISSSMRPIASEPRFLSSAQISRSQRPAASEPPGPPGSRVMFSSPLSYSAVRRAQAPLSTSSTLSASSYSSSVHAPSSTSSTSSWMSSPDSSRGDYDPAYQLSPPSSAEVLRPPDSADRSGRLSVNGLNHSHDSNSTVKILVNYFFFWFMGKLK